jgi:4-amino-4-deoxy-L-arabinose transferase-like glycosyltransferase
MGTVSLPPAYPHRMSTTIVHPVDREQRSALMLAAACGLFVFLFHVAANLWQAHLGWGYFRDEFYYLMCGRHLAWGYVDHGPLVAVQARVAETIFGRSLAGIRMLSGLAGGIRVFLTGLLAWSLGGRRAAQTLAMIAVFVVPQYLGEDGYLSMNSCESIFWMSCLLVLILMTRNPDSERLWLLFGVSAGVGLLNKPSMAFFLTALLLALLLTPQRRLLATRWMPAGVAIMLLIALPFLLWQAHHQWPTWEFLQNGKRFHKNVALGPLAFLNAQWTGLHPLNILVWLPGLIWLMRRAAWRWLGLTYLIFLAVMMAQHAKDYYVMPIYPILFAAGGVAWESRRIGAARERLFAFPVLESALLATGFLLLPMAIPVLRPEQWMAYADTLHLRDKAGVTENQALGPLPQFYADRFGWQEEVDAVTRIFNSLTPEERAHTVILCSNYGEAGAIDFLGHGLPVVVSGHNNYWLWGPGPANANIVIDIERSTPEHLRNYFDDVQIAGRMSHPYAMPYEHQPIFVMRHPKPGISLTALWPDKKIYI